MARTPEQQDSTVHSEFFDAPLQDIGHSMGEKHPLQWLVRQDEQGACRSIDKVGGKAPSAAAAENMT
jgi:hypothetical protein